MLHQAEPSSGRVPVSPEGRLEGRGVDDGLIRVLIIEDDEDDFVLIRDLLVEEGAPPYAVEWVSTSQGAIDAIQGRKHDVYLLDFRLGELNGLQVLDAVADTMDPKAPIIMLTGFGDRDVEMAALRAGAADYLPKPQMTAELLGRSIRHAIERGRLEYLEFRDQERLRLKDELLSRVSHELRTPVAAIHQFVSLVLDGIAGEVTEEQVRYLGVAMENIESLSRLINGLLDASRAAAGMLVAERHEVNLGNAVAEAKASMDALAGQKAISLLVDPTTVIDIYADPQGIQQVLVNLLDNAIKFTPAGGQIRVTAAIDGDQPRFARVCVADTGPGIAPEDQEVIFEALAQLPGQERSGRKGLGLGLHICRDIVVAHEGEIWVESEPGKGAAFWFTVPLYSLTDMLRGVTEKAMRLRSDIALYSVHLPSRRADPLTYNRLVRRVRRLMERATLPDDVVVAGAQREGGPTSLHAVAAVGALDAPSVADRIHNLLAAQADTSACEDGYEVVASAEGVTAGAEWIDETIQRLCDKIAVAPVRPQQVMG